MDGVGVPADLGHELIYLEIAAAGGGCGADEPWEEGSPAVVLDDPWGSPAARRVMLHAATLRLAPGVTDDDWARALTCSALQDYRVGPLQIDAQCRHLYWLLTAPQRDVDHWRCENPVVEPYLRAAVSWALDDADKWAVLARAYPLSAFVRDAEERLSPRARDIWQRRRAGETLAEVGEAQNVTRERIRQIEAKAFRYLAGRFRRHLRDPVLGLILQRQVQAIGERVISTASEAEGYLAPRRLDHWIKEALSEADAEGLGWLRSVVGFDEKDDRLEALDWFSSCGKPFSDGRTSLDLSDAHLHRLRRTFVEVAEGGCYARLDDLVRASGLSELSTKTLLRFDGFSVLDGLVYPTPRPRAGPRRAACAGEILRDVGRPMHATEIFIAGLRAHPEPWWQFRMLVQALEEATDLVATDGFGIWDLKSRFVAELPTDQRPSVGEATVDRGANAWSSKGLWSVTSWPPPASPDFPAAVATTLRARRDSIAGESRVSIAELLRAEERLPLLQWIGISEPPAEPTGENCRDLGVALLGALWAAAHGIVREGSDAWGLLRDASSPALRAWAWFGELPRSVVHESIVRAVHDLGLRHSFGYADRTWATTFRLQVGFLRGDLVFLRNWLTDTGEAPAALRLLSADPATGVARILGLLQAALVGEADITTIHAEASCTPWWPAWTEDELRAALEARSVPVRTRQAREVALEPDREDLLATVAPARPLQASPTARSALLQLEFPPACLSRNASGFRLALPGTLPFGAGPIALETEGARVGGSLDASGSATWFAPDAGFGLPLSGPRVRTVRLRRDDETLGEGQVELWEEDAFLRLFDLRGEQPRPLDPFQASLSASGPHAILLHETLETSAQADDEFRLDQDHRLALFRAGLPPGLAISCEGEVVWHYERPEAAREVLEIVGASLQADAGAISWGGTCELRPSSLPAAFVPTRAVIGDQVLRLGADAGPGPWSLPGYRVLPGSSPLVRRGRIEGTLDGRKVFIPLEVTLTRPPRGSALHDRERWIALPEGGRLDRSRHAGHRLWVHRPQGDFGSWVVFEGARPAAAFGLNGPIIGRMLHGLGECVTLAAGTFNRQGPEIEVASSIDTGIVQRVEKSGDALRLFSTLPLGTDPAPVLHGWSRQGIVELDATVDEEGRALTVERPPTGLEGIALFRAGEWLGTAYLVAPKNACWNLLGSPDRRAAFDLALDARLPLLHPTVAEGVERLFAAKPDPFVPTLLGRDGSACGQHLSTMLLRSWRCPSDLATRLVTDHAAATNQKSRTLTTLDQLAGTAPFALVWLLGAAWTGIARAERSALLTSVALGAVPPAILKRLAMHGPLSALPDVETALQDEAVSATRLDRQFLASRADSSVLSVAWSYATSAKKDTPLPANILTALTLPSLRHWLTAALLQRLLAEAR